MWFPSLLCKACGKHNDIDFVFCKSCGTPRNIASDVKKSARDSNNQNSMIDHINSRIKKLDDLLQTSNYSKQKCSLEKEFLEFLKEIDQEKDLMTVIPEDIRKFLIFKEGNGRTQLHNEECRFRGMTGVKECGCPKTLAAKSVDSLLGKIRAILRDIGRSGEWNPMLLTGNPASSIVLKKHLQAVSLEQSNSEVGKKQAVPMMFDKLGRLCRHLSYAISVQNDPISKYLLARDRAYFAMICHSGGRGGDLGLLSSNRLFEMSNSNGVLISQVLGKVVSINNPNNFILLPSKDSDICPVSHLRSYMSIANDAQVDLKSGCLFRVQDKKTKTITNRPVTSTCMTDRLKMHLKAINLYEGETSHSSRRGCSITLKLLGVPDDDICKHIGWNSNAMLNHYAVEGRILNSSGAANALAQAADSLDQGVSKLNQVSEQFMSLNNLKRFYF